MFFVLSKIFWTIIAPLNLAAFLFFGGVLALLFKGRRIATFLIGTGITIILVLGFTPLGPLALAALEQQYQRPDEMPEKVDGILVLGGSTDTELSSVYGMPVLNDSAERLSSAIALSLRYPEAVLMFSGGEGRLFPNQKTEADITQQFLLSVGFDESAAFYEDQSRNTYQNIVFSKELLKPFANETWLVVTSAYHMPRTMALLRSQHWPGTIIPWPADYRAPKKYKWSQTFDISGKIGMAQLALHEYLGYAAYRVTGKISSPD